MLEDYAGVAFSTRYSPPSKMTVPLAKVYRTVASCFSPPSFISSRNPCRNSQEILGATPMINSRFAGSSRRPATRRRAARPELLPGQ
jgi:hypothetical protein